MIGRSCASVLGVEIINAIYFLLGYIPGYSGPEELRFVQLAWVFSVFIVTIGFAVVLLSVRFNPF
jgi:hypothetical protein